MPDDDLLSISGDPDDIRQLLTVLGREPDLRRAGLGLEAPRPAPGQLGGVTDTLTAVLEQGALLSAATTTIGIWLGARIRPTRIKLKRGETEVEVETVRGKRAAAYARELFDKLSEPQSPGDEPERPGE